MRLAVSGGELTRQPDGVIRVGEELALLIHQPSNIGTFPKTFSLTSFAGRLGDRPGAVVLAGCTQSLHHILAGGR